MAGTIIVSLGPHFFDLSSKDGIGGMVSVFASGGVTGSWADALISRRRTTAQVDMVKNRYKNERIIKRAVF
jgi:hypothetical protein